MFKFIHAADPHIDSPLRGLERYEGAPVDEIRGATRRALEALIDLAIVEQVAFVLIAGDIFDGDWRDYNTGLYFVAQMARLREAGIPVHAISGNHDAANRMSRALKLPDNVRYFATDQPETVVLEQWDVAVHGQGFATAAVREDLSLGYPRARSGLFNIGMLHTCATGRDGHDPYAPCTIEGLKSKSYDYWALGHVHSREQLCADPMVMFPGNLQGRHMREAGPKGCLVVTVDDDRAITADFRPLDVLRWERAVVDVSQSPDLDDVISRVSQTLTQLQRQVDERIVAVRLALAGTTPAHQELLSKRDALVNQIRAAAVDVGAGGIWLEKVEVQTRDVRNAGDHRSSVEGPLGTLAAVVRALQDNPDGLRQLVSFSDLATRLPAELTQGAGGLRFDDPEWLSAVLGEVEPLLVDRLLGKGAAS